jgi:uncharacterized protein (TIGR02246 family)
MQNDEKAILEVMLRWRQATERGDIDGVMALMTDDAVFLTPGRPPMQRSDFANAFRGFAGCVRLESSQDVHDIRVSGDLAYAWTSISVTITDLRTGQRTSRAGPVLTVFRRSASGDWQLARDANLMSG